METQYLEVTDGRLAYDDAGRGPLVICVPGMGELRSSYRFLGPRLVAAGYRVATMDVRGHGETSVRWPDYSVGAIGADMLALARAVGGGRPALLVGNSFAAGAAVWAAAEAPELVSGIVLIGPAVRDGQSALMMRLMNPVYATLFANPWGVAAWMQYYKTLYPTTKPADFDAHLAQLRASLSEPGRLPALRRMMMASKAASEMRLAAVAAPTLIVMGTKDRDFKHPEAEAKLVASRMKSAKSVEVRMVAGAGHYPQTQMPDATMPMLLSFLGDVTVRD